MKRIGITGGMGSGKSTVTDYLLEKGYHVLDADKIAREIVDPESGRGTLNALQEAFGPEIIREDGSLDRKALSALAFSDPNRKARMESIMHGEIIRILLERAAMIQEEEPDIPVFIDAPLLFEAGVDRYVSETWVVDAEEEIRIRRVMKRDGVSREEVERRISMQMSSQEKRKLATHILDNSSDKNELYRQVDILLNAL